MNRSGVENGHFPLSAVRVLVVDDMVAIREVVAAILEFHGAEVSTAATADEALHRVQEWRPDALLSDLEMPGRDGYWLIAQVRGLAPECGGRTPAAALTGLTGPEDQARALKAGFQFHLAKPVDLEHLVGAVAMLATVRDETSSRVTSTTPTGRVPRSGTSLRPAHSGERSSVSR